MTNADRIRSMTDEELAEERIDRIDMYCRCAEEMWVGDFRGIEHSKEDAIKFELAWLKSEVGNE